jgi:hypothetical protein
MYQSMLISTEIAPPGECFALAVFPNKAHALDASQAALKWLAPRIRSA